MQINLQLIIWCGVKYGTQYEKQEAIAQFSGLVTQDTGTSAAELCILVAPQDCSTRLSSGTTTYLHIHS
jgi:hypothetical protein